MDKDNGKSCGTGCCASCCAAKVAVGLLLLILGGLVGYALGHCGGMRCPKGMMGPMGMCPVTGESVPGPGK